MRVNVRAAPTVRKSKDFKKSLVLQEGRYSTGEAFSPAEFLPDSGTGSLQQPQWFPPKSFVFLFLRTSRRSREARMGGGYGTLSICRFTPFSILALLRQPGFPWEMFAIRSVAIGRKPGEASGN